MLPSVLLRNTIGAHKARFAAPRNGRTARFQAYLDSLPPGSPERVRIQVEEEKYSHHVALRERDLFVTYAEQMIGFHA